MCLIVFAYDVHPDYQLIFGANRDEFHNRPAKPLSFWEDQPEILAGRDLKGMGTWLGISRDGKIAAITNFRDPGSVMIDAPTRGLLVSDFLGSSRTPESYLAGVEKVGWKYNGFNLLAGSGKSLYYYSNRGKKIQKLAPGIYSLSNHLLDTVWPKTEKAAQALKAVLDKKGRIDEESILNLLYDRSYPPENLLPDTGVGKEIEAILSSLFIVGENYGTRCSSVILVERSGRRVFLERTFEMKDQKPVISGNVRFDLPPFK